MSLGRNDECWCGSNQKYKKCHMKFDEKLDELKRKGHKVPSRDLIKNKEQIEKIKESAKINNAILDLVAENIKEGMTTEDIDKIVHEYTSISRCSTSSFRILMDSLKVFVLL